MHSFLIGFLFFLLLQSSILIFINYVIAPVHAFDYADTYIFTSNILMNVMIYILLSSIGFGVYSCFGTALAYIIQNKYYYRLSLLTVLIITSLLYSVLAQIPSVIPNWKIIAGSLSPTGLFAPGTFMGNYVCDGYTNFTYSLIMYSIFIFILYKIAYRKRMLHG